MINKLKDVGNTNQLIVKEVSMSDLEFWADMYNDPEVNHQMYAIPKESYESLWKYLHCEQKAFTVWEEDKRIGGFLLSSVAPFIGTFSIMIYKDFRCRGYGSEVMKLIELKAIEEGYKTLRADVYIDNLRSIKLLEKCGFRHFIWLEKNI